MDIYEELVMVYLTRDPLVFVSPQYSVARGWSVPDFVALDFRQHIASVVEVSAAANPSNLLRKVLDRENQWLEKLREQLLAAPRPAIDGSWRFNVKVFIRRDAEAAFRRTVGGADDVEIVTLEDLGFPWGWDWRGDA